MTNEEILKAVEEHKDHEIVCKVLNVVQSETFADRITFVLDTDIAQLNDEGVAEVKNTFSKNIYEVCKQLAAVPHIKLASAYAMGKMVSPVLLSMVMTGADITIKREFKKKDSPRPDVPNATYPKDTFTTTFAKCVTHIDPLFAPFINDEIRNPRKRATVTVDINNI